MNIRLTLFVAVALVLACAPVPAGTILIEDFEAAFPAWESGWLAANSNLRNYYGIGAGRGNNPDGLWVDDGDGLHSLDTSEIVFSPGFGASLTRFALDIAGAAPVRLEIFDSSGTVLLSTDVPQTGGWSSDPGVYTHYAVLSADGIGGFRLISTGSQVEGNTSIDNVVVEQLGDVVPEPGGCALLGTGLVLLGLLGKRISRRQE